MTEVEINNFILKWVREKWKDGKCPICKSTNWFPEGRITEILQSKTYSEDPSSYPSVHVICYTCGYTMTFNAIIMGILNDEGELVI